VWLCFVQAYVLLCYVQASPSVPTLFATQGVFVLLLRLMAPAGAGGPPPPAGQHVENKQYYIPPRQRSLFI